MLFSSRLVLSLEESIKIETHWQECLNKQWQNLYVTCRELHWSPKKTTDILKEDINLQEILKIWILDFNSNIDQNPGRRNNVQRLWGKTTMKSLKRQCTPVYPRK